MLVGELLLNGGLVKLPNTWEFNGFSKKIISILSVEARDALRLHFELKVAPDLAILRGGKIVAEGYGYLRDVNIADRIEFLLLRFENEQGRLTKCTANNKLFPKVNSSIDQLILDGQNYTANKYYDIWNS